MSARKQALNITWRQAWPIWLAFGVVFGIGAIGVWVVMPATQASTKALHHGEDVAIGVAEIQRDTPMFFSYPGEAGEKIEFFVEREADGNITAAFTSCRRCFRQGTTGRVAKSFAAIAISQWSGSPMGRRLL